MTVTTQTALPVDLSEGRLAIRTAGVRKRYGSITALDDVGLHVPEGAVYVLVGPNGAGKSTLLRTLMGLTRRDDGDVDVLGTDPGMDGDKVRALIGYVPEDHQVGYPWMTVGRLLHHYAMYYPAWDVDYARRLAVRYEVDPDRRCSTLSKGQSRRVQLLLALAHRPPVLLLDEPTDGLDHVIRDATLSIVSEHLADYPTTVVISTHRVYEVEALVDHVGVLSAGKILGQLPRAQLQEQLLRYWADVPEDWAGSPGLNGRVLHERGRGREIEWTVWGARDEVSKRLSDAGATVREISPISVDDAAVALLSGRGQR